MTDKIKVLHLDSGRGWRGGQRQVYYLLEELVKIQNLEVFLSSPLDSPLSLKVAELGVPVFSANIHRIIDVFSIMKLRGFINKNKIQIIHCHCGHSHSFGYVLSLLTNVKVVATRRVDFVPKGSFINKKKYCSPNITKNIAISNAIRNILKDYGVPEERLEIIPSCIPMKKIGNKQEARNGLINELKLSEDSVLIGSLAHFAEHKGQTFMIKAAEKIIQKNNKVHFILGGEGDLKKSIEKEVQEKGLADHFYFLGFREDVDELNLAFDYFIMTSIEEGLCSSIIDAMMAETTVVATNAGGIPDLVINDKTGYLAQKGDPISIADTVLKAIDADNSDIIKNAKAHIINGFTTKVMSEKYQALYQSILF